ncbi:uncharacterized protein LOC132202602 [Neocloeon triangulifer]|uniref:uncharacterized protein LOC132202602 n=1 Tax=Neocloeon triangulifer TaxID=2078957 RepID=UPI00286F43DF|nr:uncharacterized protein LOC132202602 [Neocloeon triangulifer]
MKWTAFLLLCAILASGVNCKAVEDIAVETNDHKNPDLIDYTDASPDDFTLEKLTVEKNLTRAEIYETVETESHAPNQTARIVGGTSASTGDFPYFALVASLKPDGSTTSICGGAILSEIWILTAATCVSGNTGTIVFPGLVAEPSETDTRKTVANVYIPSTFRYNFKLNNIALLRLSSALTLSGSISPIKISKNTASLDNVSVRTMGLGATSESTSIGTALLYADIKQLTRSYCDTLMLEAYYQYPVNTACLETSSGKKNICYVDVGGPVVYTYPGESSATLVGINSEIVSCTSVYPSAYTKVQPYVSWITSITKKSFQ